MSAKVATVTRRIPRALEEEAKALLPDVPADTVAKRMYEKGLEVTKKQRAKDTVWEMT